jgi:hypothetical protein
LPSDDRDYLEFTEAGVALQFDSESSMLETILLYTEGHDEYAGYQGELPNGIDFGHSRNEVRKRCPMTSRLDCRSAHLIFHRHTGQEFALSTPG